MHIRSDFGFRLYSAYGKPCEPETKNLTEPIEFVKSVASSVNEIARLVLPSGGYDWHKY